MEQVIRIGTSVTLAMLSGFAIKAYCLNSSTTSVFVLVIGIIGFTLALVHFRLAFAHLVAREI
ncbi:MAG: hypothetical protein AAB518_03205 [Patescibacteria group bacterium]